MQILSGKEALENTEALLLKQKEKESDTYRQIYGLPDRIRKQIDILAGVCKGLRSHESSLCGKAKAEDHRQAEINHS